MTLQQRLKNCQEEIRQKTTSKMRPITMSEDFEKGNFILNSEDEQILERSVSQMSLNLECIPISTHSGIDSRAPSILPNRSSFLRSAGRGKIMSTFITAFISEGFDAPASTIVADLEVLKIFSQSPQLSVAPSTCDLTQSPSSTYYSTISEDSSSEGTSTIIADKEIEEILNRSPVSESCSSEGSISTMINSTVMEDQEPPLNQTPFSSFSSAREHSRNHLDFPSNRGRPLQNQNNYQRGKSQHSSYNQNQSNHFNQQNHGRDNLKYSAGRDFRQQQGRAHFSNFAGRGGQNKIYPVDAGGRGNKVGKGRNSNREWKAANLNIGRGKSNNPLKSAEPSFGIALSPSLNRDSTVPWQPTYGKSFSHTFHYNPLEKPVAIGPVQSCHLQYQNKL